MLKVSRTNKRFGWLCYWHDFNMSLIRKLSTDVLDSVIMLKYEDHT